MLLEALPQLREIRQLLFLILFHLVSPVLSRLAYGVDSRLVLDSRFRKPCPGPHGSELLQVRAILDGETLQMTPSWNKEDWVR